MTPASSPIRKRSILIRGRKTSVSLEDEFWTELHRMAQVRGVSMGRLALSLRKERPQGGLSGTLRVAVLNDLKGIVAAMTKAAAPKPTYGRVITPAEVRAEAL
jgi:predicted DNA-binding ribbon-helix-helix protein